MICIFSATIIKTRYCFILCNLCSTANLIEYTRLFYKSFTLPRIYRLNHLIEIDDSLAGIVFLQTSFIVAMCTLLYYPAFRLTKNGLVNLRILRWVLGLLALAICIHMMRNREQAFALSNGYDLTCLYKRYQGFLELGHVDVGRTKDVSRATVSFS